MRRIIYLLFFLSGAAGLVYEVVWARQLALFIGGTTYAHTAIIAAYMIGLAAGGLWFGRVADRRDDALAIYAWLEVGIGLYAAATIVLFGPLRAGYAAAADVVGVVGPASQALRFGLSLGLLTIGTFLMGVPCR